MSGQFRPELARAYEQYLGQKGGVSPNVAPDVLPVVILDDNAKGPYPACRLWQGGGIVGGHPGIYPKCGVQNCDDGFNIGAGIVTSRGVAGRSVVVVDKIILRADSTAGGDFYVGITHNNVVPFTIDLTPADDRAPEKDVTPGSTRPQLGNVHIGERDVGAVGIFGNTNVLPGFSDGLAHEVTGPWILGPGQICLVERNLATSSFWVSFFGRYYPQS